MAITDKKVMARPKAEKRCLNRAKYLK